MDTNQRKKFSFGARAAAAAISVLILAIPMVGSSKESPKGASSHASDVEMRIKTLRTELKITPQQETAWNDVAQAMRDNAKTMTDIQSQQAAEEKTASAPAMILAYGKTMDAHAEAIHKFVTTFQPLYDSMSDTQKKTADSVFRARVHEAAKKDKS